MSTIKQIAKKIGVSPTTVSNVIHGRYSKVSDKIREKVEIILRDENYAPNMAANILARNNSRIISIIIFMEPRQGETQLEDPFSSTILGTVEAELRHHGYFLMVHSISDKDEILRLVQSWKLAGIILLWVPDAVISAIETSVDCPVVYIDSDDLNNTTDYLRVSLDDWQGSYDMTRYLTSMGHRKLAFIANGPQLFGSDYDRFHACKAALEDSGYSKKDVEYVPLSKDRGERKDLFRLLSKKPKKYTALCFSSDYYASEAILFFQVLGVDIPGDLSITGFDDNIFSRIIRPRITTVHQDTARKGQAAVDLLIQAINGEKPKENYINLPVHLEIRDSVRKID